MKTAAFLIGRLKGSRPACRNASAATAVIIKCIGSAERAQLFRDRIALEVEFAAWAAAPLASSRSCRAPLCRDGNRALDRAGRGGLRAIADRPWLTSCQYWSRSSARGNRHPMPMIASGTSLWSVGIAMQIRPQTLDSQDSCLTGGVRRSGGQACRLASVTPYAISPSASPANALGIPFGSRGTILSRQGYW